MADSSITRLLSRPRLLGGLLALASAAMLAGAFYFQHVEGLQPCPLCIAQRWAHAASLALGLIAFAFARDSLAPWLLGAVGLAFVAGAGIAGYHVGVEQHWIESSFCGSSDLLADTVEELKALLWETEIVRCDEIPWSLAGISMAGYNLIISIVLAVVAFMGAHRARKVPA
jgi:disulfide bond formation protein DsbB